MPPLASAAQLGLQAPGAARRSRSPQRPGAAPAAAPAPQPAAAASRARSRSRRAAAGAAAAAGRLRRLLTASGQLSGAREHGGGGEHRARSASRRGRGRRAARPSTPSTAPARASARTPSCRRSTAPAAARRVGAVLLEAVARRACAPPSSPTATSTRRWAQALIALGYDRDFDLGLDDRGAAAPGRGGRGRPRLAAVCRGARLAHDPRRRRGGHRRARPGRGARPRRHRQGAGRRPRRRRRARAPRAAGCWSASAATSPPRARRPRTGGGSGSPTITAPALDAPGQWITIALRRPGHLEHHRAPLALAAARPSTTCSTRPAGARPHGGWRTVSVAAATCLDANIASTAAIVRGERRRWRGCGELGLPSRLVDDDGRVAHIAGWPAGRRRPARAAPAAAAEGAGVSVAAGQPRSQRLLVSGPRHRRGRAAAADRQRGARRARAAARLRPAAGPGSPSTRCTATCRCW